MFILILIAAELAILFYAFKMIFGHPCDGMHTPKTAVPAGFLEFIRTKDLDSAIEDIFHNAGSTKKNGVAGSYKNFVR